MPLVTKTFADIITFTRASTGTYFNATGTLQSAGNDVPRFDYDPSTLAPKGFLVEEQRTNSIRNNTMVGAVAGTPGTPPTNWAASTGVGITRQLVGTGTENGVTYIDYRFSGTGTVNSDTQFDQSNIIVAASGQTWAHSCFIKLQAGALTNVTVTQILAEYDSGGLFLASSTQNVTPTTAGLATQRFALTRTLNNASTAYTVATIRLASAGAIDVTLRIGLPQLEQGAFATSAIPTSTAAITRAPDLATVNTLSPWYNASAGTLYAEGTPNSPTTNSTNQATASIDDNTANNRIAMFRANTTGAYGAVVTTAGVASFSPQSGTWANGASKKMAVAYASGDQKLAYDGLLDATTGASALPVVTRLSIGMNSSSVAQFNGWLRRVIFYPRRLSNAELQTLTT